MRAYGGTDVNHAPFFLSINPEILSVDLDIKSAVGMGRLRDLIAESDIVINNLRPGAMERQGLGYTDLAAIKPDIISVSIKMWGNDGPLGYQTGYAPSFAALSGLSALVGYRGGGPLGANMRYGDSTVGAAAAFGALAALLHREATGEGQFVDVSAVETLSSMIGDSLLDARPHGRLPAAGRELSSRHGPTRVLSVRRRKLAQPGRRGRRSMATLVRDPRRCNVVDQRVRHRERPAHSRRGAGRRTVTAHRRSRCGRPGAPTAVRGDTGRQERHCARRDRRRTPLGPRVLPIRHRPPGGPTPGVGRTLENVDR